MHLAFREASVSLLDFAKAEVAEIPDPVRRLEAIAMWEAVFALAEHDDIEPAARLFGLAEDDEGDAA